MKYLIIICMAFLSCTKSETLKTNKKQDMKQLTIEAALSVQQTFIYTTVKPSTNDVVKGARTTCDVVKFSGTDKKSISITMYLNDGYWIQTGYHMFNKSTVPFTQIWKDGQQVGVDLTFLANPALPFGAKTSFAIYNVPATNKWRIARGGVDCIELNLFTDSGLGVELYTEEGPVDRASKFPKINFYPAIETFDGNTWTGISSGIVGSCMAWGLQGKIQKTSLQLNEVNIGSGYSQLASDTVLF